MSQTAFQVQEKTSRTQPLFETATPKKYKSSSLKLPDAQALVNRMDHLMDREKVYLNPTLSLSKLARRLNTNTKYLSQSINLCFGINFHQYVNTYRIAEIKSTLKSEQNACYTYYGLAQKCGFKNKSTFYKVFKEMTGLTPGDYIEHHQ